MEEDIAMDDVRETHSSEDSNDLMDLLLKIDSRNARIIYNFCQGTYFSGILTFNIKN